MFDRKRPCANCPFRTDMAHLFRLPPERLEEIRTAVAFQCHKTLGWDEGRANIGGGRAQQCAGLMAVLHAEGAPNLIMRKAAELINYDPGVIDTTMTFSNWEDVVKAHRGE